MVQLNALMFAGLVLLSVSVGAAGWHGFASLDTRKTEELVATPISGAASIGTDANTRAILTNKNGQMCAEPVPDVVISMAAAGSIAASGAFGPERSQQANFAAQLAKNPQLVKLFERSQGIQALRDGMYRLCEGNINGAIPKEIYTDQVSDLIATLNFIVPIELCSRLNRELTEITVKDYQAELSEMLDTSSEEERVAAGELADRETSRGLTGAKPKPNGSFQGSQEVTKRLQILAELTIACISTSSEFANNVTKNAGQRTIARLQEQSNLLQMKQAIYSVMKKEAASCEEMSMILGSGECSSASEVSVETN